MKSIEIKKINNHFKIITQLLVIGPKEDKIKLYDYQISSRFTNQRDKYIQQRSEDLFIC